MNWNTKLQISFIIVLIVFTLGALIASFIMWDLKWLDNLESHFIRFMIIGFIFLTIFTYNIIPDDDEE